MLDDRLVCRGCGRAFGHRHPEQLRLPGMEDPPAEFCPMCVEVRRRLLARAIRGPLPRIDVNRNEWYAKLRADGLTRDAARLLVEAFAPENGTGPLRRDPRRKPSRRGSMPRERSHA